MTTVTVCQTNQETSKAESRKLISADGKDDFPLPLKDVALE